MLSTQQVTGSSMADFSFLKLNEDRGTETGDVLRNVANAAADLVCDLYEKAPTGIIPQFGDVLGVGQFTQGLARSLCDGRNPPPPEPVKPFSGGQCDGVTYVVTFFSRFDGNAGSTGNVTLVGKIGAPVVLQTSGDDSYRYYTGSIPHKNGVFSVFAGAGGLQNGTLPAELTITNISRPDGLPDNCGSLPAKYPARDPQPSDYETTRTVKQPGGNVSVPVTLVPVFAPITNIFRPEFNVKVGDISVTFDLGGVHFHLDSDISFPVNFPPIDPRLVKPPVSLPKSPSSRGEGYNFDKIHRELEDIKECACDEVGALLFEDYGLAGGREITLPYKAIYVEVSVQVGSAVRYQASEGNCPDVHFAGWSSFGRPGGFGRRVPISFEGNVFAVPKNLTHFAYSLVFGSEATIRVYYEA